jgi:hypothetical protein
MSGHARGKAVSSRVIEFLIANPNVEVAKGQIARACNVTEAQVSHAMYHIKTKMNVEQVANNTWRYKPGDGTSSGAKTGALYSQVGVAGNGDHVIEDENGKLYRAVPL